MDAAGPDERHMGSTAEAKASEAHIRKLNVPYQPLRGTMCLPVDCWELNDFDFDPLSESRQDGKAFYTHDRGQ